MGRRRTDEFRRDAVRIGLTSGLTRKQVSSDLGIGMSTLNKWITEHRDTGVVSERDQDLARENERLRRCRYVGVGAGAALIFGAEAKLGFKLPDENGNCQ